MAACSDPSGGILTACDFIQALVDQTPRFDELIMEDIRPTDGWLLNVSTGTTPMGTPVQITQDRFRNVWPNVTKAWNRVVANGPGCTGNPCDPPESQIGWGADRLTYYAEEQTWSTPLLCYNQDMHITHAEQHLAQIINDILRPATTAISSMFLRKRHLQWAKRHFIANSNMDAFTFNWSVGTDPTEEIFLDTNADPTRVFLLVPQMLQSRVEPLLLDGYAGKNPFKETTAMIEGVSDMDTVWMLDKFGGQMGSGAAPGPTIAGNWRFEQWDAANKFWRYGFSGQLGNYGIRVDPMNLRFNYVTRLINGQYRYQIVLPYRNGITSGAGGSSGLGSDVNPDWVRAQYRLFQIHHKKGMELLVPDARPLNPEMPFGHRDFGGKWRWMMHDLGSDRNGVAISNKWENKGQFGAWFKYYVRPLHYEFMETIFHKSEQQCIPELTTCRSDPGYPAQEYNSALPPCDDTGAGTASSVPAGWTPPATFPPVGQLPTDTFQTPPNE